MMTQENVMENIKAGLDAADPATLQSIWAMLNRAQNKPAAFSKDSRGVDFRRAVHPNIAHESSAFVGENLTLDEYERLLPKERGELQQQLREQNYFWLQEHFAALKAAWLVVVNGEIIAYGQSLKNLPLAKQNVEVAQRTGKFPFVFINEGLLAIEESASTWHSTVDAEDYYPSLPATLTSSTDTVEVVGDFDTGASSSFVDYDFMHTKNLIQPEIGDYFELSRHLGQPYHCVAKPLLIRLSSKSGTIYTFNTIIYCVTNWRLSPFVKINPNRVALIGRDLLLGLKPRVLLDFDQCHTEILSSSKTRQTRKKIDIPKKPTSRSKRRR